MKMDLVPGERGTVPPLRVRLLKHRKTFTFISTQYKVSFFQSGSEYRSADQFVVCSADVRRAAVRL